MIPPRGKSSFPVDNGRSEGVDGTRQTRAVFCYGSV